MQVAPTVIGDAVAPLKEDMIRPSMRSSSQRLRKSLAILARSLSRSGSLSSASCTTISVNLEKQASMSFAGKRKRVRFARKPSVHCLPSKFDNVKSDLWWSASELEKMSISEVMRCFYVASEVSVGNYLASSDHYQQYVSDGRPISSYNFDPILEGLKLGYRGIEKYTETGRFQRIENREFVKKIVSEQSSMTPEDIQLLCADHSAQCVEYANSMAILDTLVVDS